MNSNSLEACPAFYQFFDHSPITKCYLCLHPSTMLFYYFKLPFLLCTIILLENCTAFAASISNSDKLIFQRYQRYNVLNTSLSHLNIPLLSGIEVQ